jgi:hypothetical protein
MACVTSGTAAPDRNAGIAARPGGRSVGNRCSVVPHTPSGEHAGWRRVAWPALAIAGLRPHDRIALLGCSLPARSVARTDIISVLLSD